MQSNRNKPVQAVEAHSRSPQIIRYQDHLKEGDPVLVRILGERGKGRFEASVAGLKIFLTSEKPMKPGDTFTGKLGLSNGAITITPLSSENADFIKINEVITAQISETSSLFEPVSSAAIASLLASLNLPSDNLSFRMLLQFKQLGMRFDPKIMGRIRRAAEKSDNPVKTMEEQTVYAQKKIFVSKKSSSNKGEYKQNNNWNSEIKKFVKTIFDGSLSNAPGELTVMNHMGFSKKTSSENTWITIPFEIGNPFDETVHGSGKIQILLGSSDKFLRQINIHADLENTFYRFALYPTPGSQEIKSIAFSISGNVDQQKEILKLQDAFSSSGKIVSVKFVPFENIDGYAEGLENFSLMEGNA